MAAPKVTAMAGRLRRVWPLWFAFAAAGPEARHKHGQQGMHKPEACAAAACSAKGVHHECMQLSRLHACAAAAWVMLCRLKPLAALQTLQA